MAGFVPVEVAPARAAITEKGYDAKSNREATRSRGVVPIIPHRSTAKDRPKFFPKQLYKLRARVEQLIGKIKRFKRIAMRCEKIQRNYAAIVALAGVFLLIKSVYRA